MKLRDRGWLAMSGDDYSATLFRAFGAHRPGQGTSHLTTMHSPDLSEFLDMTN